LCTDGVEKFGEVNALPPLLAEGPQVDLAAEPISPLLLPLSRECSIDKGFGALSRRLSPLFFHSSAVAFPPPSHTERGLFSRPSVEPAARFSALIWLFLKHQALPSGTLVPMMFFFLVSIYTPLVEDICLRIQRHIQSFSFARDLFFPKVKPFFSFHFGDDTDRLMQAEFFFLWNIP